MTIEATSDTSVSQTNRVNWVIGAEALAAAWSLASVASWYHTVLPLCGAAPIAVFALFGPLRLGSLIRSRSFQRFVLRLLLFAFPFVAAAFTLTFVVNSGDQVVADAGSGLFLLLLGILAFVTFRAAKSAATRVFPVVLRTFGGILDRLRLAPGWLSLSLPDLPSRQTRNAQRETPPRP